MNFDDEEHRVKRILDDESDNTDDTDDKKNKNIKKDTNENMDSDTQAHISTSTSDKNTPHSSDNKGRGNAKSKGSGDANSNDKGSASPDGDDNAKSDDNYDYSDIDKRVSLYDGDISESDKKQDSTLLDTKPNDAKKDEKLTGETSKNDTVGNSNNGGASGGASGGGGGGGGDGGDDNNNDDNEDDQFIPPSQAAKKKVEEPMGLLEHLSELRRRLTRIVMILLIGFFGFYGVSELAYAYLASPLVAQLPEGSTLIYTSPQGAFFTYLKVALMLSVIGTSPFTFYQIWAFIAPGLYKEEQGAIAPLAFFSAFFFICGAAFCYFMVFPVAFKFFIGFTSDIVVPMISVEEYLSFTIKLIIAFGLVFEMPLFAYFLAKMRIITPEAMRKHRKYAVLSIFVIAAVLTPPDVFSQVLMACPMLILYEISIYVAKVARGKAKKEETEKKEESEEDINDKINNFK